MKEAASEAMRVITPDTCLKARTTAIAMAIATILAAMPAQSAESDRVGQLEQKLEQNLRMIEVLQKEIQELKQVENVPVSATDLRDSVADQSQRLNDIENAVQDIDERVGSRALVRAFDAESLDLGGFLHQTFTYVDGDKGSTSAFNATVFELLVKAQFNEQWSAFLAQAFMRVGGDPFAVGSRETPRFSMNSGTDTVIAWANYKHTDAFNVQLGRFITPQGIVNIKHFPAVLLDPEQPQFLRPFGSDTVFANFTTGLHVHGRMFVGQNQGSQLNYNVYAGDFAGNTEDRVYGARTAYGFGDSGITLGINYNGGERRTGEGAHFDTGGLDLSIDRGRLLWESEIFASSENSDTRDDRLGWYTQPAWRITPKWTAFYRYDFLDDGSNEGDRTENVAGLTYKPTPSIHLRAIATYKDFDKGVTQPKADATLLQFSGTFSF